MFNNRSKTQVFRFRCSGMNECREGQGRIESMTEGSPFKDKCRETTPGMEEVEARLEQRSRQDVQSDRQRMVRGLHHF